MSLSCSFCKNTFTKQRFKPISLPCKHIFCIKCIEEFKEKSSSTCPSCKKQFETYTDCHMITEEYLEDDPIEEVKQEPPAKKIDRYIFLSYAWGEKVGNQRPNQDLIRSVRDRLVTEGFKVWMDIFKLGMGNLYENLQNAINSSAFVLCFINDAYIDSENCRMEFFYARELVSYYEREHKKNKNLNNKLTLIPIFLKSYSILELKYGIGFVLNSSLRVNGYPSWTEDTFKLLLKYINENLPELSELAETTDSLWNELESKPEEELKETNYHDTSTAGNNDVFILYSKKQENFIPEVREKLQRQNSKIKIIHHEDKSNSLSSSTDFRSNSPNIESKIDDSKVVLCFLNKESIESNSYLNAIKYAKSKYKKTNSVMFENIDLSGLNGGNGVLVASLDKIDIDVDNNGTAGNLDLITSKIDLDLTEIDKQIKLLNDLKSKAISEKKDSQDNEKKVEKLNISITEIRAHTNAISSLLMYKENRLISGSYDGFIKVWDLNAGNCMFSITAHPVTQLVLIDEDHVVSSSSDSTLRQWNLSTGYCVRTFTGHEGHVSSVVIYKQNTLVSGSADTTIRLWSLSSGECAKTLNGYSGSIKCLTLTQDNQLISGSSDHTIKVWSLETFKCIQTLSGHDADVRVVLVNNQGDLISGSDDFTIKIWDLEAGKCLRTLTMHSDKIRAIIKNDKDKYISGSADKTIKIWNKSGSDKVTTLFNHKSKINALVLVGSGYLASAGDDGFVKIFDLA